jgi:hypothetical protein
VEATSQGNEKQKFAENTELAVITRNPFTPFYQE